MRIGGDLPTVRALKAAGATPPGYASTWIGPWTRIVDGESPALAAHINVCRREGVLPFVNAFLAGDQITEAFFDGGVTTSRGASLGMWWALVKAIGSTLGRAGVKGAIVNLELEWFKEDLQDGAPKFDQHWENAAHTIRNAARGTLICNTPGAWAPASKVMDLYPRMVAATDIWAAQFLRSLPRSSETIYSAGPDELLHILRVYSLAFPGKRLVVSDLGFSTYGDSFSTTHPFDGGDPRGADDMQEAVFERLLTHEPKMKELGVTDIIIRSLQDVDMDVNENYHGYAERHWGVQRKDGSKKPAHAHLLALAGVEQKPEAVRILEARNEELTQRIHELQGRIDRAVMDITRVRADLGGS